MNFRLWMMAAMGLALASPVRADYFAIDLSSVGIQPVAVNSSRQFAGTREVAPGQQQAYRWDNVTSFTNLGTLGGTNSSASAINEQGWVAGTSRINTTSSVSHAFLWQPGVGLTDLGTLGGTSFPTVSAVNATGVVVGASPTTGNAATHAFVWQPGVGLTDLGTLGGNNSVARGVNDAGTVVGASDTADGGSRPFIWTEAGGLVDLGGLGGPTADGSANDINNNGVVVGQSTRGDGTSGAFVWNAGVFTDLGGLGGANSVAFAINNLGEVVGTAQNDAGESLAFLWDATNGLRSLNSLLGDNPQNVSLTRAIGITDSGDILAESATLDGTIVYLVTQNGDLNPPPPTNEVPAPPALVLAGLGLPLAGLMRRKRSA
ncbi:hypothetical protein [Limnoglobus roseus]|uniref:PEP-CTERM sorting domain-containing protein n=1 Tax=Limnoglobus roseus TaxID=2598579 RepID=A0A5C1A8Q3_9BACT|nr:hypothetical protein [Limnoglobus roseus]QEL13468.1 hypothetical protein PX52LOC_00325 [Limnoglobus roseus]